MKNKLNDIILNNNDFSDSLLDKNSFANFFNVVNLGKKSYFNLIKGISFENLNDIDPSYYDTYEIMNDDCWTNISYKFYETTKLWWLICKFNEIDNPFDELKAGDIIKIPNDDLKKIILDSIKNY